MGLEGPAVEVDPGMTRRAWGSVSLAVSDYIDRQERPMRAREVADGIYGANATAKDYNTVRVALVRYARHGWVVRVRRGLYSTASVADPTAPEITPFDEEGTR